MVFLVCVCFFFAGIFNDDGLFLKANIKTIRKIMALIYCYRWSCYSWRETTKSQPTFFFSLHSVCLFDTNELWKWCKWWNKTMKNRFVVHKMFPGARFDSVQWSWIARYSHTIPPHMQLSYAQQKSNIWCWCCCCCCCGGGDLLSSWAGESNRSWLFPFGSGVLFTNPIIP